MTTVDQETAEKLAQIGWQVVHAVCPSRVPAAMQESCRNGRPIAECIECHLKHAPGRSAGFEHDLHRVTPPA